MCAVECCAFLCTECRNALAKAEGDAEAHRMRCASLETQLEAAKRAGLESDRRAHEAEAATVEAVASWLEARTPYHSCFTANEIREGAWRKT